MLCISLAVIRLIACPVCRFKHPLVGMTHRTTLTLTLVTLSGYAGVTPHVHERYRRWSGSVPILVVSHAYVEDAPKRLLLDPLSCTNYVDDLPTCDWCEATPRRSCASVRTAILTFARCAMTPYLVVAHTTCSKTWLAPSSVVSVLLQCLTTTLGRHCALPRCSAPAARYSATVIFRPDAFGEPPEPLHVSPPRHSPTPHPRSPLPISVHRTPATVMHSHLCAQADRSTPSIASVPLSPPRAERR